MGGRGGVILSFYCDGACKPQSRHIVVFQLLPSHLLMMSSIIVLLSLYHSLPSSVSSRNVPAPLLKGPTYAQLQDSRSGEYHEGLVDQHYGENDYHDYHDYHHHHHHQYYQPEQRQPPLPSWVVPLIALVRPTSSDI